jgi:type I restriction enzyme M protein
MELMNKFAIIAENLSAKFPDLDEFYLCIHILGYASGFDQSLFFSCHSDIAPLTSHFTFDKNTLQKIEEFFPFSISHTSEEDKRELCKYFLEICLRFERHVEIAPENPAKLFSDLSLTDPQAVFINNGNYSVNVSGLSAQSYKQFIDWDIERYFYYKTPRVPKQINEKIVAFAELKSWQTVYDPNCGDGSLFVEFYSSFPNAEFKFNGVVGSQFERFFCLVNFYVNGILDDKRIEFEIEVSSPLADEISYRNRKNDDDYLPPETANIAVSFVPSKRQLIEGERDSRFFGLSYSLEQPEYAYIELMLNAVRDTGKAIAIVSDKVLYSPEGRFFREAYLSRDWIESVISLPENSFSQNDLSEASILVFNKNKLKKGIVVFDGEGSKFERTEIKNDAILSENNIDLRAARYALKETKSIQNILDRHQEKISGNSIVSSIENVTLNRYFDDLAETFSEEFPTVKNTVYLYLLTVVVMILDRGNQWLLARSSFLINPRIYNEIESHIYSRYYKQIIEAVLDDLANKGLSSRIKAEDLMLGNYGLQTESPVKDAFRELCKNLIDRCLQIESKVESRNLEELWKELAEREPKAIQLDNQSKTLNFEGLKERLSSGIGHVQIGKYNSLVNFAEFSDRAYQELSESSIAQSFSYEKNQLHRFGGLDKTLAKISNPKPKQEIFNLTCGIGSLFIELQNQFPHHDLRFTGRVDDGFFYMLCQANLLAHNVDASVSEQDILDSDIEFTFFGDNPDIAFGIVPLGLEVLGKRDKKFFPLSHKRKNVEYSLIELLINSLNETGKAVVVVPERFLHTGHAKGFKKEYLKNDWVESVISLPEDTFGEYGSVKASIVVFNKNKAEKGFITFKSLDSQFEDTKVSLDEILSSGSFDLRVNRYASEAIKELNSILKKYSPDEVKKIKDLIDLSVSGTRYSPSYYRITENTLENLPYVRVKDLSNSNRNFTLDVSKVQRLILPEEVKKTTVIDYSAVLVSKIIPNLKPTLFNFEGQPIVISPDVVALKVKTDCVSIEYFLLQFESQLVRTQVQIFSTGTITKRIYKEDLLNVQIILPSLPEQELQIFERSAVGKDKAIAEEKIERAEEEIQQTEYDVIATISHNLSQKLGKIGDDYNTLIRRLNRGEQKSSQKFNELFGDKENFDRVVNRLHRNIEDANETMATTTRILQKNKISVEQVNILQFLKNEITKNYSENNFEILIETKLKSLIVPIDKDALKDAIRNLIENAQKHGFKNVERKFKIIFEISKKFVSDGTEYASIIYKNDGEPLPKGFSFEEYKRLGGRAGETRGTGLGGFWVNKVIGLHKGKFNYIPVEIDSSSPYKVVFEILLPLE